MAAFALAKELHISPLDLNEMDYAEVKFFNDELGKMLKQQQQQIKGK